MSISVPANTIAIIFTPTNWKIQVEDKVTGEYIPTEELDLESAYSINFILANGGQTKQFVGSKEEVKTLARAAKTSQIKTFFLDVAEELEDLEPETFEASVLKKLTQIIENYPKNTEPGDKTFCMCCAEAQEEIIEELSSLLKA